MSLIAANQTPLGLLNPACWSIVHGYVPGLLAEVLATNEQSLGFGQQVQAEYDRNLVIFWDAVGYGQLYSTNYGYVAHRLAQLAVSNRAWFSDREYDFVKKYAGTSIAVCPETHESAETIRMLFANQHLQDAVFLEVDRLEHRSYRPVHEPMTLVVPELDRFPNVRYLSFGNEPLLSFQVDLRRLPNLVSVDIRDCGLEPEHLLVDHRIIALTSPGNVENQVVPDILSASISFSTYLTRALTEYRGDNSSLQARVGYTFGYLALLVVSIIETIVRGVFSILGFPLALLMNGANSHADAFTVFDMTVLGAAASGINAIACVQALYANLATEEAINYEDLTCGLSHKQVTLMECPF